jgi:hypothetical protein
MPGISTQVKSKNEKHVQIRKVLAKNIWEIAKAIGPKKLKTVRTK